MDIKEIDDDGWVIGRHQLVMLWTEPSDDDYIEEYRQEFEMLCKEYEQWI